MAHEIGHVYGLGDCSACTPSQSVMATPGYVNDNDVTGRATSPTDCDNSKLNVMYTPCDVAGRDDCNLRGRVWNELYCFCNLNTIGGGGGGDDPTSCMAVLGYEEYTNQHNNCMSLGGASWYDYPQCRCSDPSPVLIDINGDGFRLTNRSNGVLFDINSDGQPDQIPWTEANSDDAWLVLDRNGNGVIDNGQEVFGNFTEQTVSPNRNGFLALAEFDKPVNGGNGDGVIDRRDAVFTSLSLWQDWNHDGISDADELHTLPELDVAVLHLNYKESKRVDEYGNEFRYRAKVDDARKSKVGRWAWDVFLVSPQ
jgi:hypothetical protein